MRIIIVGLDIAGLSTAGARRPEHDGGCMAGNVIESRKQLGLAQG